MKPEDYEEALASEYTGGVYTVMMDAKDITLKNLDQRIAVLKSKPDEYTNVKRLEAYRQKVSLWFDQTCEIKG